MAAKYKKGDRVQVITGKDKGKQGEILRVLTAKERAVVQGVNVARRHTRPSQTSPGGIVNKEMPIAVSNLAHIDPKDDKPTRVGFKFLDDGRKVRFAKRSGEVIDN
ncbi:MAG: 50S ribosomal protein L24 [Rickettsiales bacterium]|jgi:large subunit ribosomal protein L24